MKQIGILTGERDAPGVNLFIRAVVKGCYLNHNAALSDGTGGALWLPDLLEEGCHSAGFVTTIHLRHHLLLSIGWRFICLPPNNAKSMSYFISDVNGRNMILIKL